jgi:hypothetical protein
MRPRQAASAARAHGIMGTMAQNLARSTGIEQRTRRSA